MGISQGSILGHSPFLTYLNNFLNGLNSNAKLFPDKTSLSVVHNITGSANLLHEISLW